MDNKELETEELDTNEVDDSAVKRPAIATARGESIPTTTEVGSMAHH